MIRYCLVVLLVLCQVSLVYADDAPEAVDPELVSLEAAAEAGDADAQVALARRYRDGKGVDKDPKKALALYQLAEAKNHPEAQLGLGILYYHGMGVEKDGAKALDFFEASAAQGNASSLNYIGHAYQSGFGVEQSTEKAIEYYQRASELENAVASTQLGQLYFSGTKEMAPDYSKSAVYYAKALRQFRRAALDGGQVGRRFMLKQAGRLRLVFGTKIARREPAPVDGTAFVNLLAEMVEWGDNPSLGVMVLMHKEGINIEKSERDALKWLLISEAVVKKAPHLAQIAEMKEELSARLSSEDISYATAAAEAWKERVLPENEKLGWVSYD